jgi:predicted O-linked N-acetylglucosamine transferase (SPINDLY family)
VVAADRAIADALERLARRLGRGEAAQVLDAARELHRAHPSSGEAARLYAVALLGLGQGREAREVLVAARRIDPDSIEILCNLGSAHLAQGDAAAALEACAAAQAMAPAHPAVLNGLGSARRAAGDPGGARDAYAACTDAAPGYLPGWLNRAATELDLGLVDDADLHVRHALGLARDHPQGWLLLGHVLAARRQFGDADRAYAEGARLAPGDARFPYQAGLMAEEQGHPGAAAVAYERALTLDPRFDQALAQLAFVKRRLCDWDGLDAISARLRQHAAMDAPVIAPFGFLAEPATAREQLNVARAAAARIAAVTPAPDPRRPTAAPAPAGRLRVGFVSNGFGEHPTGLLTVAFFEALAGTAVEAHLFATAPDDGGPISRRLQRATRRHAAAALAPAALAAKIRAAGIDILVDLRVWADGGSNEAFALRPAPIQVNWLAYPGTSGAAWMDYVIADRMVLPPQLAADFSEAVAWMPRCFQPSDPTRIVATPPAREACGLPAEGVVYVCFNNSYKLNRPGFERMLAILGAVPGSVLWLLSGPDGADQRLARHAQALGIDARRLVFMPKLPHADYLARYRHADLFLDTGPYNAHTTASDALWAGCPLLTVAGGTFAGRVAASLNHHLGMAGMNAADDPAFIETAVHLGRNADARTALRAQLECARRDSGLFDMDGFARDLAELLGQMAARRRAGAAPAPLPAAPA